MEKAIRENLPHPGELERLYRSDKSALRNHSLRFIQILLIIQLPALGKQDWNSPIQTRAEGMSTERICYI